MHDGMLTTVLRAPMLFFNTTPYDCACATPRWRSLIARVLSPPRRRGRGGALRLGRIVNRFSKDQSVLDDALPRAFGAYLRQLFYVTGIFVVIAYSTPIFLVIILPLGTAIAHTNRRLSPNRPAR